MEGCFELVRLQPASVAEVLRLRLRGVLLLLLPGACLSPSPPTVCLSQLMSPQDPHDRLKSGPSRRRHAIPARSPGSS